MATIPEIIGNNVQRAREAQDWRQSELADRVAEYLPKWSRQAVWSAERGEREFTATELVALSLVLGRSIPLLLEPVDPEEEIALTDEWTLDSDSLSVLWSDAPARGDVSRLRATIGSAAESMERELEEIERKLVTTRKYVRAIRRRTGTGDGN